MTITIWGLLILLCGMCLITHPTKRGCGIATIFLLTALAPEPLKFFLNAGESWLAYTIQVMVVFLGVIVLSTVRHCKLKCAVMYLFIAEMLICGLGILNWGSHLSAHLSNYIFDISGFSISGAVAASNAETWLYNISVNIYYGVAMYILYDRKGRSKYVGCGVLQYLGDTLLAPNLLFKNSNKRKGTQWKA